MYFTQSPNRILKLLATLKDGPYERPAKALVAAALLGGNAELKSDATSSNAKPVFIDYNNPELLILTAEHIETVTLANASEEIQRLACTWPLIYLRHNNKLYFYNRKEKLCLELTAKGSFYQSFDRRNKNHLHHYHNIKINLALSPQQVFLLNAITPAEHKTSYTTPFLNIKRELYQEIQKLVNSDTYKHQLDRYTLLSCLLDSKPHFFNLQQLIIVKFNTDKHKDWLNDALSQSSEMPALNFLDTIKQQNKIITKKHNRLKALTSCKSETLKNLLVFCQTLSPENFYETEKDRILSKPDACINFIHNHSILILVTLFGFAKIGDDKRFTDMLRKCAHQIPINVWADLFQCYPKFINLIGPSTLLWLQNPGTTNWLSFQLNHVYNASRDFEKMDGLSSEEHENKKYAAKAQNLEKKLNTLKRSLSDVLSCLLFHKRKLRDWVNTNFITQLCQSETTHPPLGLLIKFYPALIYKILTQKPEFANCIPTAVFYQSQGSLPSINCPDGESIFTQLIHHLHLLYDINPIFLFLANNKALCTDIQYKTLFMQYNYYTNSGYDLCYTAFGTLLLARNPAGLDALLHMLNNTAISTALTVEDLLYPQNPPDDGNKVTTIYDELCLNQLEIITREDGQGKQFATQINKKKEQILTLIEKNRPGLLSECARQHKHNNSLRPN